VIVTKAFENSRSRITPLQHLIKTPKISSMGGASVRRHLRKIRRSSSNQALLQCR